MDDSDQKRYFQGRSVADGGASDPEPTEANADLRKLADELRRPSFHLGEILGIICFTIAPLLFAWWSGNPWFLLGLILPVSLANTVRLSRFRTETEALKRALISQLPASQRKEFLQLVYKHKRLAWCAGRTDEKPGSAAKSTTAAQP